MSSRFFVRPYLNSSMLGRTSISDGETLTEMKFFVIEWATQFFGHIIKCVKEAHFKEHGVISNHHFRSLGPGQLDPFAFRPARNGSTMHEPQDRLLGSDNQAKAEVEGFRDKARSSKPHPEFRPHFLRAHSCLNLSMDLFIHPLMSFLS